MKCILKKILLQKLTFISCVWLLVFSQNEVQIFTKLISKV